MYSTKVKTRHLCTDARSGTAPRLVARHCSAQRSQEIACDGSETVAELFTLCKHFWRLSRGEGPILSYFLSTISIPEICTRNDLLAAMPSSSTRDIFPLIDGITGRSNTTVSSAVFVLSHPRSIKFVSKCIATVASSMVTGRNCGSNRSGSAVRAEQVSAEPLRLLARRTAQSVETL